MAAQAAAAQSKTRIDSHLHVWAPLNTQDKFPFQGGEPPIEGHAELLIQQQTKASVNGALIIQPSNHKFDHSYVTSILKKYPDRFVGCLLADPTRGMDGVTELQRLVQEEGYGAVRFNPYIWPEGETMDNEVGRALFQKAGELGCPVGVMCFKGLLLHIKDIKTLCTEYPDTRVILDHFGFCKAEDTSSEEWRELLGLARFPQVYVKTSAFFRVSSDPYPYNNVQQCIQQLLDSFGAARLMWGSDFPWVEQECGYESAWNILESWESAGVQIVTEEQKEQLYSKTLQSLFPSKFRACNTPWVVST